MKKSLKSITLSLLLAFTAISFVSCGHEPVFYGIMHDVAPETATINGNIASIARCSINSEEYLVLSNGGALFYKPVTSSKHGEWKTQNIKLPFNLHHYNYFATDSESDGHHGQQILRVIADKDNIYLLTADFKQDDEYGVVLPNVIYLWTCPLSTLLSNSTENWKDLANGSDLFPKTFDSSTSELQMDFNLFFTNTPKAEHRKAFLSVKDSQTKEVSYYLLNGDAAPTPQDCSNYVKLYEKSEKINSAFYIGSNLYFTDSLAVSTNETAKTDATLACIAGINKNGNKKFDLYSYDGTNAPVRFVELSAPVSALAFTANSILIGQGSYSETYTSNGGIERVLLNEDGSPQKETSEFENNGKYQFTSSYILLCLLCADPAKEEAQANLYAAISFRGSGSSSSASPKDVGLWSYYPSRGNWNRE